MLTARDSVAETGTPDSNDSFPLVEKLYKRGLSVVGLCCSTANTSRGDGEEALSGQRYNDIYYSTSTLGSSVRGKYIG